MTPQTDLESLATRFAAHIELLREFFASRGLRFGTPADLSSLADRLAAPGAFRNEMSAMLRTIIYRENMNITRPELLEVVIIASGGLEIESSAPALHQPMQELQVLVNEVLQSLRKAPMEELEEPAAAASISAEEDIPRHRRSLRSRRIRPRFASAPQSAKLAAERAAEQPAGPRRYLPYSLGVGAVLLAFLAGWLLHRKAAVQAPAPPVVAGLYESEAQLPKPSAYGNPLHPEPDAAADVATQPGTSGATGQLTSSPAVEVNPGADRQPPIDTGGQAAQAGSQNSQAAETSDDVREAQADLAAERRNNQARGAAEARPSAHHHGLFTVSSGLMSANLISAPRPEYPFLARLSHIQGQVILQVVVGRNGDVAATHVLVGHHLLRGAAENAVRRWRYRPYLVNGTPVNVETVVFVNFRLHR